MTEIASLIEVNSSEISDSAEHFFTEDSLKLDNEQSLTNTSNIKDSTSSQEEKNRKTEIPNLDILNRLKSVHPNIFSPKLKVLCEGAGCRSPQQNKSFQSFASSHKTSRQFNYGEWMFAKHAKMQATRKRNLEAAKKKIVDQESKELTFKPRINRISSLIASRSGKRTENILIKKGEEKRTRIHSLKKEVLTKEKSECPFNPIVNSRSIELDSKRNNRQPRHKRLFSEALKRKDKLSESLKSLHRAECSFQPEISPQKTKRSISESRKDALKRLSTPVRTFRIDTEEIERSKEPTHDSETGKRLFHPTLQTKLTPKRETGGSVFDHLYNKRHTRQSNSMGMLDFSLNAADLPSISLSSAKIYERFRLKQYYKLFGLLDKGKTGAISKENMSIDCLNPRVLDIISPVLVNIEESEIAVNFDGFKSMLDSLLVTLSLEQRGYLLKREPRTTYHEASHAVIFM